MLWAEQGHRVVGVDINEPLTQLARKRALMYALRPNCSNTWPSGSPASMNLHACFAPAASFFSARPTAFAHANRSSIFWYPGPLKRHFERLAVTNRPNAANYTKYPAVNWFTFYELRDLLTSRGFVQVMDCFDIAATKDLGGLETVTL